MKLSNCARSARTGKRCVPVWLLLGCLCFITVSLKPAAAATAVISNERSGDLIVMTDSGELEDIIPLCSRPRGMVRRGKSSLFIACSDDAEVIEYDLSSRQRIRTFRQVPGAMSLAIDEASHRLLVSNEGSAQATILDIQTGHTIATLPTGLEPDGVAFAKDGELILIASENASLVHVFNGRSYEPISRIITNLRPRRMAVRGDELWVSSEMGSRVEIFDINSFEKTDEIIFAPRGFRSEQLTPVDILFDDAGSMAFVALGSANHVVLLNAESREILKYILVGRRPWGLGLTPDGKRLFVLNGLSDDVTIIDVEKMRPVRTSRTGLVPHSIEIIP